MSEIKPVKSSQDVQLEYNRLCSRAGHLQYTISTLEKDLEQVNEALRDLNQQHHEAREREKALQAEKNQEVSA
jgi:chromosome segregation ATPase